MIVITMNSLPQPNPYGVFNSQDAELFRYEDGYLWVEGHLIQCAPGQWLGVASFNIQVIHEKSGTMGCHCPLKVSLGNRAVSSRADAIERIRDHVRGYIATGRCESQSKAALRSWSRVEQWVASIDRQLDLFEEGALD